MKYLFIIIYFLFFYSYPTLGNGIIGKGFVCKEISKDKLTASSYRGFWVVNKKGYEWWAVDTLDVDDDGEKFEFYIIFDSHHTHYFLSEDDLILRIRSTYDKSINTDIAIMISRHNLISKHFSYKDMVGKHQCKLYDNKNNFLKRLDDIAKYYKNENQKKLQKRKF